MVADGPGKGLDALLASAPSFSPDTQVSGVKTERLCDSFLFIHITVLVLALCLLAMGPWTTYSASQPLCASVYSFGRWGRDGATLSDLVSIQFAGVCTVYLAGCLALVHSRALEVWQSPHVWTLPLPAVLGLV